MIRILSIHPQRRGFRHHFRVVLLNAGLTRRGQEASVYVNEEELYNYHRFQLAGLTQLGTLCRFAIEDEADTPHQLQMLWNRELSSADWGGLGLGAPNALGDADVIHERAAASDQLRISNSLPDDEEALLSPRDD